MDRCIARKTAFFPHRQPRPRRLVHPQRLLRKSKRATDASPSFLYGLESCSHQPPPSHAVHVDECRLLEGSAPKSLSHIIFHQNSPAATAEQT
ncbi:hypothetical protein BDW66DRAFT_131040 [Aspergillus desertorum]